MAAKIQMIFEGDSKKVVDEMEKMRAKLRSVEGEFGRLKEQGRAAGKAGSGAADKMASAFGALGAATGPLAAAGMMLAQIRQGFEDVNAEAMRGAESTREAFAGLQKLSQISGGDPAEFRQLISASAGITQRTGLPFGEAMGAMFAGRSIGLTRQEIESISPFARIAEFEPVVRGVGKIVAGFGREKAGSVPQIGNKMGVAAATSDISMAEFAPALAQIVSPAKMIGVGDKEAMATLSVLSAGQGATPEIAATQIRALMTAIRKSPRDLGVRGAGSLMGMVGAIGALPEDVRAKHFEANVRAAGALEAITARAGGIHALSGRLDWEQQFATGTPTSYMRGTVRAFESHPLARGALRDRIATERLALAEMEAVGEGRIGTQATIKEMATQSLQRDEAPFIRAGRQRAARRAEHYGLGEGGIRIAEAAGGGSALHYGGTGGIIAGLIVSINDLVQELRSERVTGVEDNRTQIFYGDPDERAQMRSPSGRRDPSIGR